VWAAKGFSLCSAPSRFADRRLHGVPFSFRLPNILTRRIHSLPTRGKSCPATSGNGSLKRKSAKISEIQRKRAKFREIQRNPEKIERKVRENKRKVSTQNQHFDGKTFEKQAKTMRKRAKSSEIQRKSRENHTQ